MDGMMERRCGPGGMMVDAAGRGAPVVLVHGGGIAGEAAWRGQAALAGRWRLLMPYRIGYAPSRDDVAEDFQRDAPLVAALLGDGAHLVGHSYGGLVALLAAALRPEALWSLTVIESGSSAVARGHPAVDRFETAMHALAAATRSGRGADPDRHVRALFRLTWPSLELPDVLPEALAGFARRLPDMRWPTEAVIPLAALAAAPFPKLHVSGGHNPVYEAITDRLAAGIGGERCCLPGGGHAPHRFADRFNPILERFLTAAEAGGHAAKAGGHAG